MNGRPPRNACSHPRPNIRIRTSLDGSMRIMPAPRPRIQGISQGEWRRIRSFMPR
jgi:hypothetical protein